MKMDKDIDKEKYKAMLKEIEKELDRLRKDSMGGSSYLVSGVVNDSGRSKAFLESKIRSKADAERILVVIDKFRENLARMISDGDADAFKDAGVTGKASGAGPVDIDSYMDDLSKLLRGSKAREEG